MTNKKDPSFVRMTGTDAAGNNFTASNSFLSVTLGINSCVASIGYISLGSIRIQKPYY